MQRTTPTPGRSGTGGVEAVTMAMSLILTVATSVASPSEPGARGLLSSADQVPLLSSQPAVISVDGESLRLGWQDGFRPVDGDRMLISCGVRSYPLDFLGKGGELQLNSTMRSVHTAALINMRCNYTASFARAGKVLAQLQIPLAPGLANSPTQGHIAFGDTDDQMHVLWVSASDAVPTVRYSTTPSDGRQRGTPRVATGSSGTYTAAMMCSAPANQTGQQLFIDPGRIHRVLLQGLLPDTDYYYSFGSERDGFSDERRFRSKPSSSGTGGLDRAGAAAGAPSAQGLIAGKRPVKFLAFADQDWDTGVGGSPTTANYCLRDAMESGFSDFLLHFGDISYAESTGTDWEHWSRQNEPLASRVPYMVSIGNHEYDYTTDEQHNDPSVTDGNYSVGAVQAFPGTDGGGECAVPVVHRFRTPSNGNGVFWYSFDYSPLVHVVMLSSEHHLAPGSAQHEWLIKDLERVRGSSHISGGGVPWVVVTMHRMLYTTQLCEETDYTNSLLLRKQLEATLRKYRVNLVLVGHQHSFERSCAVYDGKCVGPGAHGTVHATVGTAGAGIEKCGFDPTDHHGNFSVARANKWGYARVAATEETMTLEFVTNEDGAVWDTSTLRRWD